MRPTGQLHLGHYHGVLKNWLKLQHEYECFFFVADWHALTTHYEDSQIIGQNVWQMVIDWLAYINPMCHRLSSGAKRQRYFFSASTICGTTWNRSPTTP